MQMQTGDSEGENYESNDLVVYYVKVDYVLEYNRHTCLTRIWLR